MKSGLTSVSRKSEVKPRKSSKEKKKQLNLTNQWLEDNYCVCEGVCIPRCILYAHYLEFCQTHGISPSCAATFGKIIRQKFPNITTRRLGTRGHSKYHYYGICIKEDSQYYQSLYSSNGLTRFSGSKFINEGGFTRKYNLASKVGCTLPSFPNSYTLALPPTVDCVKEALKVTFSGRELHQLDSLLKLYRTHCQSILDVVVSSLFLEVPNYLSHFWQSLPSHLRSLLEEETVSTLVVYCDSILHHSLIDVLIPSTMQEVSEGLLVEVQHLANGWETWLGHSMTSLPRTLVTRKANAAQIFCQALRRQATFLHLAQMVRPILYDCHMVNQIVMDVNNIQMVTTPHSCGGHGTQLEYDFLVQLKEVLHRQATVEAFTEWLDATVSRHIVKPCGDNKKLFKMKAHTFLLSWTRFGTELMQAMTSQNCASLTSFNLLKLLLDEYVMVAIESQLQDHADQAIMLEVSQLSLPQMGIGASIFCSKGNISLERSPISLPNQGDDTTQNATSTTVIPTLSSSSSQSSCKYVHKEKTTPMDAGSQYWSFPSYYVAGPPAIWQSVGTEASASFTGYEVEERDLSGCSQLHVDYCKEGYDTHLPPIGHVLY